MSSNSQSFEVKVQLAMSKTLQKLEPQQEAGESTKKWEQFQEGTHYYNYRATQKKRLLKCLGQQT